MPVSDSLVFTDTGLPVVYIKTFSGKEVASKEVYEEATIEIRDGEGNIDIPMQIMEIHGRGNSSWNILWKKRGYTIKLNKKSEVLGMPKDKKWVLIANYRDKTLLRNSVAWWLSERLSALKWTPRYRQVEVVINGTHRGTFQLVEQVKISKDRVDINEMFPTAHEEDDISGGYIIELDRNINDDQWEWVLPNMRGIAKRASIKEPKIDEGNELMRDYIYNYLMTIDSLFANKANYAKVIEKYIDMPSWAAQWLIFEISGTTEPNGPSSWFTYKDKNDDKWYCGPTWDFDHKSYIPSTSNKWINSSFIYMPMMLKYPPFKEELCRQWKILEPLLPELIAFINSERERLCKSAKLNWDIHHKNLIDDNRTENGDEFLSSDSAIDIMIDYLKNKWEFISNNIEKL